MNTPPIQTELFDTLAQKYAKNYSPLAERIRPDVVEHFFGQEKIFEPGTPLSMILQGEGFPSLIFWGPPGTGKTTLARIVAKKNKAHFESLSAVYSNKKELLRIEEEAKNRLHIQQQRTLVFIDEIHRFNKAQQDSMLGAVEQGLYTLIGATTENPSFSLNNALLSRCQVIVLEALSVDALEKILLHALNSKNEGLGKTLMQISKNGLRCLIRKSKGDARSALNLLELAAIASSERHKRKNLPAPRIIDVEDIARGMDKRQILFDSSGDEHYNTISAFIKSVRGSDPDASVYYLARLIRGGEDPLFIARRLLILASEDIGNADPHAVVMANSIFQAVKVLGMPEARISLSQLTVYLSLAPKSNASYKAINLALSEVDRSGSVPIPKKILNAPTALMKELGYGKGYRYAHDYEGGHYAMSFLPDTLSGTTFYFPTERDHLH